jgi:hypothetical protein
LYEELSARLDRFGAPDAARRLQEGRSILREAKPVVREVLSKWRRSVGTEPVAEQLWELQTKLGRRLVGDWQAHPNLTIR